MPEGDSIHKLANALTRAIVGKTVRAFSAHTVMDHVARTVIGARVESATARGKNLLVAFDDGRTLHIHLRMLGRVRIVAPKPAPRRMPQLWIEFDDVAVMGWKIPVLRLLRKGAAERVPEIASLGPDLLAEDFDERDALARFRANPDCENRRSAHAPAHRQWHRQRLQIGGALHRARPSARAGSRSRRRRDPRARPARTRAPTHERRAPRSTRDARPPRRAPPRLRTRWPCVLAMPHRDQRDPAGEPIDVLLREVPGWCCEEWASRDLNPEPTD